MVVKQEAVMQTDLKGLKDIRPVNGWSSLESCRIKLLCENCTNCEVDTDWQEITLGIQVNKRKWKAVKTIVCKNCPRKAEVFVNEFLGEKRGNETVVMRLQADGLQPIDNFLQFDDEFLAEDIEGNLSLGFMLDVRPEGGQFEPQFTNIVGYERVINRVLVSFKRV